MSKIIDMVKAERIPGSTSKSIKRLHMVDVKSDFSNSDYLTASIYRIGVVISTRTYIEDGMGNNNEGVYFAVKKAQELIREEIFGEFRPILHRIQLAVFEQNLIDVKLNLDELEKTMFEN